MCELFLDLRDLLLGNHIRNFILSDLLELSHLSLELCNHLVLLLEVAFHLPNDVRVPRVLPDRPQFRLHPLSLSFVKAIFKLTFGVQIDVINILLEFL